MRYFFICLLGLLSNFTVSAQQKLFNYDDYFYYRNHLYLNTPSVFLNAAILKAASKDTSSAISYMEKAAEAGLFDTSYITSASRLKFVTNTRAWKNLRNKILSNRVNFADPEKMFLSFDDINRFWAIYDKIDQPGGAETIMVDYILKGSPGLRTFFEKRMGLQANSLVNHVRKKRKYYSSIRNVSLNIHTYRPGIIAAAKKLKTIYPEAFFPPTWFTMGSFDAFGTADGGAGQLIGAEFFIDKNTVDSSELTRFEKVAMADTSRITGIIIHELIHSLQQTSADNSLLAGAINEGAADFISDLVLGYNINSKIHDYGNKYEKELWKEFSAIMLTDNADNWLYNGMSVTGDRPADLGYYIGYKICEAFYKKTADKQAAIRSILTIRDFPAFLKTSGYNPN